ncbi:MAG TPA: PKD domain-containing protein, partial [Phnomibacter sp.]|nr:PKD domain-containing protein [Phnomibacter sp.]
MIQTTCQAADSVLVNVLPSPALSFTNAGDCSGETITFTPFTGWPPALESTLSWKWRFNDAGSTPVNPDSSLAQIATHIFNAPGTYNVQLNTRTPAGCTSTVTQPVVIKVGTAAGFSVVNKGNLAYCIPVKLVQKVAGGMSGVTNIYPDYPSSAKVSLSGIPVLNDTVTIDYKALGIPNGRSKYIIKWENIESAGCISVKYDTITLDPNPAIRFTALSPVCVNTNTFLVTSAKDTMGVAGKGWYQGNGIDSAGNFNPLLAGVGTHSIKYTFQSNYGCQGSASQNIVVNPVIPIDFIVNNRNALCHKIPVNLTQNANGGVPGKSTIYFDYPSSTAKVEFPTSVPAKGTNIVLDYSAAGIPSGKPSYIVRWENLTPQGCSNFKQDTIVVNPSPSVNFSALAAACVNASPYIFTAAREVTGISGKGWYQGPGVDSIGNFNPSIAGIGTHSMKYTFRTNAGCRDSAAQNMVVNAIIPVDFSVLNRNALCYNPTVDLVQNANGGITGTSTIYLDYGSAATNVSIGPNIPVKGTVIKLDYRSAGITQGKPNHIIR